MTLSEKVKEILINDDMDLEQTVQALMEAFEEAVPLAGDYYEWVVGREELLRRIHE